MLSEIYRVLRGMVEAGVMNKRAEVNMGMVEAGVMSRRAEVSMGMVESIAQVQTANKPASASYAGSLGRCFRLRRA